MKTLLGQADTTAATWGDWMDRFPCDELLAMFVVGMVFSTVLIAVVAWCVTSTIRAVLVASANARMAEKLAGQGMPGDQIARLVQANSRSGFFGEDASNAESPLPAGKRVAWGGHGSRRSRT